MGSSVCPKRVTDFKMQFPKFIVRIYPGNLQHSIVNFVNIQQHVTATHSNILHET